MWASIGAPHNDHPRVTLKSENFHPRGGLPKAQHERMVIRAGPRDDDGRFLQRKLAPRFALVHLRHPCCSSSTWSKDARTDSRSKQHCDSSRLTAARRAMHVAHSLPLTCDDETDRRPRHITKKLCGIIQLEHRRTMIIRK